MNVWWYIRNHTVEMQKTSSKLSENLTGILSVLEAMLLMLLEYLSFLRKYFLQAGHGLMEVVGRRITKPLFHNPKDEGSQEQKKRLQTLRTGAVALATWGWRRRW